MCNPGRLHCFLMHCWTGVSLNGLYIVWNGSYLVGAPTWLTHLVNFPLWRIKRCEGWRQSGHFAKPYPPMVCRDKCHGLPCLSIPNHKDTCLSQLLIAHVPCFSSVNLHKRDRVDIFPHFILLNRPLNYISCYIQSTILRCVNVRIYITQTCKGLIWPTLIC